MTAAEFHNLKTGDIVRHISGGRGWIVTDNFGTRITAVKSADLTNPAEWDKVIVDSSEATMRGLVGGMD